jgi:ribose transport system substrate-binding protein
MNQEEEGMIRSKMPATSSAIVVACFLTAGSAYATEPDVALQAMKSQVYSTGPNGEKASPASEVTLTPEELAKVKDKHATAALVFHYGGNDWSNAQLAALKAQFAAEGVDVVAVTDAGFKPEKQVADIETVMAKKPDIIVSIPVDAVATAAAYGVRLDKGVAGLHGQCPERLCRRQGLRQLGLSRQFRKRSRRRAFDGEGPRREG